MRTHEEFICKLKSIQPDLTLISTYINSSTPISIKDKFGIEYTTKPYTLLNGVKPSLATAKDKTNAFKIKIKNILPSLEVIGPYCGNNVKILIKDELGIEYLSKPNDLLKGCYPSIQTATNKTKAFEIKLSLLFPNLKILSSYINSQKKILIENESGIQFLTLPNDLLRGVYPSIQTSIDKNKYFKSQAKNVHGELYNYDLSDYSIGTKKIKIICNNCEFLFLQRPDKHLQGEGCPYCKNSKGEIKIQNLLKNLKIDFDKNKTFPNCKFKSLLKFDFYIPKFNLCIEYDGKQHFEPYDAFGGDQEFELIKKRDKIKNDFCQKNNINLIRISYKDFKKIDSILKTALLNFH